MLLKCYQNPYVRLGVSIKNFTSSLETKLENSYSKSNLVNLEAENINLRIQVQTLELTLDKFSNGSNNLNLLIKIKEQDLEEKRREENVSDMKE